MAGRYQKQTVDYFPHYVDHGRVLFIMESTWGALGYAAFYKLLEVLGRSEGHYFFAGNYEGREYLAARMGVTDEVCQEMMCKLAKLDVLDRELWQKAKVIWMQSFVDSLDALYRKRVIPAPEMPSIDLFLPPEIGKEAPDSGNSGTGNKQRKVKESKEKKDPASLFDRFWSAYPKKKSRGDALKAFQKINPDEELLVIMVAKVEAEKATKQWKEDNGRFIPHPATWLNGRRWEDEGVEVQPAGGNNGPGLAPLPVKSVVCPNCGKDTDEIVDGKCIYCIERKSVKHFIGGIGKPV